MKVLKFGGTSIGTPERILEVKRIIESQSLPCVVVVSAFGGVTDDLLQAAEAAASGNKNYSSLIDKINIKHKEFAEKLIKDKDKQQKAFEVVESISNELIEFTRGIFFLRELTRHSLDQVLATGERISSF